MKKGFTSTLLLVLLIIVSVGFAYYYGTQQSKTNSPLISQITVAPAVSEPIPTSTIPHPPTAAPTSTIPVGWQTYTNQQYGFEISFPSSYKSLTDSNNLYGWPNGIVLIYKGGQSYDLAIEHWILQSEYENKYKNQSNLTVKKIGNFYLTLLNTNLDSEVDNIIQTFKIISP